MIYYPFLLLRFYLKIIEERLQTKRAKGPTYTEVFSVRYKMQGYIFEKAAIRHLVEKFRTALSNQA
jgi:hypothetical protein